MFKVSTHPSIAELLGFSRPLHISLPSALFALLALTTTVIAIVVDAVNRMTFRHVTKHRNKSTEGQQAFADRNTSPAIVLVVFVLGIIASLPHASPRVVLGSSAIAVLKVSDWSAMTMPTARFGSALNEIAPIDFACLPAVTDHKPPAGSTSHPRSITCVTSYRPHPKHSAR